MFPVTLEYASNNTVTVYYYTSDGTARSPHDYTSEQGAVTFAPGTVSKTVTVPVPANPLHTGNLYFYLNVSSAVNAVVNHGSGTGTVIDPTLSPYLNLGDANAVEGSGTAAVATFTATLSAASANPVTFRYATQNGSARGRDRLHADHPAPTPSAPDRSRRPCPSRSWPPRSRRPPSTST